MGIPKSSTALHLACHRFGHLHGPEYERFMRVLVERAPSDSSSSSSNNSHNNRNNHNNYNNHNNHN